MSQNETQLDLAIRIYPVVQHDRQNASPRKKRPAPLRDPHPHGGHRERRGDEDGIRGDGPGRLGVQREPVPELLEGRELGRDSQGEARHARGHQGRGRRVPRQMGEPGCRRAAWHPLRPARRRCSPSSLIPSQRRERSILNGRSAAQKSPRLAPGALFSSRIRCLSPYRNAGLSIRRAKLIHANALGGGRDY